MGAGTTESRWPMGSGWSAFGCGSEFGESAERQLARLAAISGGIRALLSDLRDQPADVLAGEAGRLDKIHLLDLLVLGVRDIDGDLDELLERALISAPGTGQAASDFEGVVGHDRKYDAHRIGMQRLPHRVACRCGSHAILMQTHVAYSSGRSRLRHPSIFVDLFPGAGSRCMTAKTARTFTDGPQPGRDVDTVRDIDGDTWERWIPDDDRYVDVWAVPFDPDVLLGWDELLREFGPLEDASDLESEVAA